MSTSIHEYEYYDTRTRPVNIRILKIFVPVIRRYSFTIFISYLLRVLSTNTKNKFFDILNLSTYFTLKIYLKYFPSQTYISSLESVILLLDLPFR